MPPVKIYTTSTCPYCHAAKQLLNKKGVPFDEIDVTGKPDQRRAMTAQAAGRTSVPQIFIGARHVGGCDDLYDLEAGGQLDQLLATSTA